VEGKDDMAQQTMSRQFLKTLSDRDRTGEDVEGYSRQYAHISKELLSQGKIDKWTQCHWYLKGLPKDIRTQLFLRHSIDLDEDEGHDLDKLIKYAVAERYHSAETPRL
jgi:hypothetical protein